MENLLSALSLSSLHVLWKDVRSNTTDPYHVICDLERIIENEYYSRTGEDIRRYGK